MKKIETDDAPKAIGPYSQAVLSEKFLFVSGQIPIDLATGQIIDSTIEGQTRLVFDHMASILKAAGLSFEHVAKVEVYLKEMKHFQQVNAIYAEKFPMLVKPARQVMQVVQLPLDALIEISCIAVKNDS
ncbi:MAG: yabJ [Chlamydiales bacterium]|jgi:2-iminobutanoate/2-iminopropanoate deaminase|nr:yabJ [Chlamydiales bacterium]